ncbi:MAG TPA: DUF5916 domain-containing protein [Gemmatimonadaceae bacterium]|nr:DUF5916 domain-containing protein [Gemmatimonadaceae bacterium]
MRAALAVALCLAGGRALTAQGGAQRPTLRVTPATTPIRVDGVLNEPAWQRADSIATLQQIEPREGSLPTGTTVVRVLATESELFIGIRADDPEPDRITAFARQRDASLSNEDHVRIVLDTYLDGRSGYVFIVNPYGARFDALITNQGESEDVNWDTIWEAATSRDSRGWSVEIRIPAKSLLFRTGLSAWGFNVQRRVQRFLETDRWASPDRDIKINMMSRAGLLTDIPHFFLGFGSTVRPGLKASAGIDTIGASPTTGRDACLDVTQRLGANALASLTVNTDFAETEVDSRRTNLTRFPLFFPEKRTFFLEGSDIFSFGLGRSDAVIPFHSRRIGLIEDAGLQVPLDAGLKINGRAAGTSYGALVVRTGAVSDTFDTRHPLAVARVRQNVLGESYVGAIATVGDPVGRDGAWTAGTDLTYQTTHFHGGKNLLAGVWGLASDRVDLTGSSHALGGKIDYPNDLWDIATSYSWIGDSFAPSLGFVPRPGVQSANLSVAFQPRPQRRILGLPVRQMFHEFESTIVTDLEGRWESYRVFTAPLNWRLETGDRFEFNFVPVGEQFDDAFEIADGVVVQPGTYQWTRWRLEAGTAPKRRLSAQGTWWFGEFYSGRLDQFELEGSWKPSPLFITDFSVERNVGRLAEGSFATDVVGVRLRLNVSPDLQVNSYVQYDDESNSVGTNTRLRWSYSPAGDLYIVYNHNVVEPLDLAGARQSWRFASNQLLVKAQYAFRY